MYTFDIVGVASILSFFNQQQAQERKPEKTGVAYISSYECNLDALIKSVEGGTFAPDWVKDDLVQSVLNFWLENSDSVKYWKRRLQDAGEGTVVVARVADDRALRQELELMLRLKR
jgi:hypothetical protein